ncbi:MetQ/NlpA family ABC transporter substrate-binding protein [Paenibacillus pinihumi]|uniref:MetQ/NlpA family ABC transporter substrate-binding protein n=1 Tax=Paenibacillus pinihumi TaxID=669462 RepID=UPI00041F98AC|nr:MetQ/NlpA family ABC transporter substrate-binding protein [Paenibacillus pinihumi]
MKKRFAASLLFILSLLLTSACGNQPAPSGNSGSEPASGSTANTTAATTSEPEKPKTPVKVKIGVTGADGPQWELIKNKVKEQNIEIDLVEFSDYTLPNLALANGEVDINAFQHLAFLSQFNVEHNLDIVPIGSTAVSPLGLYSKKYASPDEIPDGAKIAIPNDPSNQGRGLLVLEQAGLLKLKDNPGLYATPDDIVDNPRKLTIVPVVAQQTPRVLPDVAASIINGGIAGQAGYKLSDAIFHDDPHAESTRPYVNVFAVREQDKDNEIFQAIAKSYQEEDVIKAVEEDTNGASFVTYVPVDQLQATLDQLIENIKAAAAAKS